jgi:hypothetical protein
MTKEANAIAKSESSIGHEAEDRWRRYPHLDEALVTPNSRVLKDIELTKTKLVALRDAGIERERERARLAVQAYETATALYDELCKLRDESLATK